MIGTSDQSCWLAEACKILLRLLLCNMMCKTDVCKPCCAEPSGILREAQSHDALQMSMYTVTACKQAAHSM